MVDMITKIQEKIGTVGLIASIVFMSLITSWIIVLLFTYVISLLFAGSVFTFDWSVRIGTGFWFIFLLISVACGNIGIKN